MARLRSLPFKVGHHVETKSFVQGYRGAWFRCVIKKIDDRKGVALKYTDYEDEKIRWMRSMYQKVPGSGRSKVVKEELMVRPRFPPVYRQGEAPDVNTLSEVIVVTNGAWKVGDLVDWLCEGAYWSGTITELLGDDKVQLQLPPMPLGEDLTYEALCKDLRPSLVWSKKSGWKVPVPKENNSNCPCAQLIHPVNQGEVRNEGIKESEAAAAEESPSELNASASRSSASVAPQEERRAQGEKRDGGALESGVGKGSCSDSVSSSTYVRASAEVVGEMFCKENTPENETTKRIKLNKSIPLNSSTCDSVESLIVDMEELLNRVKWMRRILEPPESENGGWKFQEYRAVRD